VTAAAIPLPAETQPRPSQPSSTQPPQPAAPADAGHALQLALWKRFHIRLTLIYGAAVFLVLAGMGSAFYLRGVSSAVDNLQARLAATAVALAQGIEADQIAQLRDDKDRGSPVFKELIGRFDAICKNEPDITSIYVLRPTAKARMLAFVIDYVPVGRGKASAARIGQEYDASKAPSMLEGLQRPVVESEPYTDEWGESLSGYAPIPGPDGETIGLVGLDVSADGVRRMKRDVLLVSAALFSVALLFLLGAAAIVARSVRRPLTRIIDATTAIASGRLETRANLMRDDEFGILGQHFDEMAKGLQERELIRSTFGRYVSEDVARRILSNKDAARLGGEVREVTVLFSDLRGYSTISETLSPTETVGFLNEYLAVMNEQIDQHGGCIIEFLGDAILAVFGAPGDLDHHPERAARCAVAMRQALAGFNERMDREGRAPWKAKGMAALGQRIGIHTGQVVAGNLGSKVRVKYAVIGDAVNVASRVEGLNKQLGTEILLTASTHERLGEELRAKAQDKGAHPVKGRAQAVPVFAI
jgi:adenylate cyclase